MDNFEEYIRQGEPDKQQRAYAWRTAIGLQAVDGLKTSDYLQETARRHIEGEIDINEAKRLIRAYYQSKTARTAQDDDLEEADIVSSHITELLGEQSFSFSVVGITSIHRRLFEGVFKFAGKIRDYDITKKEWVLRGDTVLYTNCEDIRRALEYDLEQERQFVYSGLSHEQMIEHIAKFVSGLWQIHPFGEGNTRTTAVFAIKYLRSLGFNVNSDLFAGNSWYFRNALVRANYRNIVKGVDYEPKHLIFFFRNLLLGEHNELHNRSMIINPPSEWQSLDSKSRDKAYQLWDSSLLQTVEVGTARGLQQIHAYIFGGLYDFAGQIRQKNISKGGFQFAVSHFLGQTLRTIERMPETTFDEITDKYVEMNVAHPFMEGNGRSTRIWLDLILKRSLKRCVDWSQVDKNAYMEAMRLSPVNPTRIKELLATALTDRIDDREMFMKGIDYSYYYEQDD